jgi:16S rRNA (cytosine1402-N4)-methyltransferase
MEHVPVMLAETLQQLAINAGGNYLDATFGRGGHSAAILGQLGGTGRLLALDRDAAAITSEAARALQNDGRFQLRHSPFSRLQDIVESENLLGAIDGILLDLGVSSPQLDDAQRGFSFMRDGPLDMRMDTTTGMSATEWLAVVDEKTLVKVLFEYGEERFARRIARAVIDQRVNAGITSTKQLASLIADAVPIRDKHKHPATRTFQAIRIAVNDELGELKAALEQAANVLKPGGRLVVIAFHSLEDRMVKRFFRAESGAKYDPGKMPVREADIAKGILKTVGKAIKASELEVAHNIRARSAIMRVTERR